MYVYIIVGRRGGIEFVWDDFVIYKKSNCNCLCKTKPEDGVNILEQTLMERSTTGLIINNEIMWIQA